jgi:general secretion pathway protein K
MRSFDCGLRIADCGPRKGEGSASLSIRDPESAIRNPKSGSALIIALWVLIILSLLVGSFAFEMNIESGITSYYRKRMKTQYLSRAGIEYAKLMIGKSFKAKKEGPEEGEDEETYIHALNLQKGNPVSGLTQELGDGRFVVDILPEQGRRNVNTLTDDDWEEVLDQGNVPQDMWPELIDCFQDYTDEGDEHQLNGAESDDAFYMERNYECKNAPLDTVDELAMIKGFTQAIVFGGPSEEKGGDPYPGIAQLLTTWGDGKVNVNTASREVLLTLGLEDFDVDDIIKGRAGVDEELGTKDDGWESVDEVMAKLGLSGKDAEAVQGRLTTTERTFVRVISKGEVEGVRSGIWAVFQADASSVIPLFWREEDMP